MTRTIGTLMLALCAGSLLASDSAPQVEKGEQLFADDFSRQELGQKWKIAFPTFEIADGAMQGAQTKEEHGAVAKVPVNFKDGIIECRFKLDGAKSLNVVFDDKTCKESHAGHICRVIITPRQIRLQDDRDGVMRNDIFEMREDASKKAEREKLIAGTFLNVPVQLEQNAWHTLAIQIVGDNMHVSLDGNSLGNLKSAGIGHETKNLFGFAVNGQRVMLDDVKIWAASAGK